MRLIRTRGFSRSFVLFLALFAACSSTNTGATPEVEGDNTTTTTEAVSNTSSSTEPDVGGQEPDAAEQQETDATDQQAAGALDQDEAQEQDGDDTPDSPPLPSFPDSPLAGVTADLDGALLGISTGLTRAERAPRFDLLEELSGRQLDIGHVFHTWDTPIPTDDDLKHLEDGRILMISWNGTDTIEIQNGVHDDWIRTQATSVRDLGQPVMLRWLWEMDARRRQEVVHSGDDYIAAWIHIREIFDEVGASNAQFVWCPNEFLFWDDGDPTPWYPGDENVDWLCADGYNWQDSVDHPEWVDLTDIFGDFYAWAEPRGLPIVIGETGSNEALDDPEGKADWFRSLPETLENELPAIDAVVYFDKDFTFQGHADWRVDTSDSTFSAWNEVANDPYFNPLSSG